MLTVQLEKALKFTVEEVGINKLTSKLVVSRSRMAQHRQSDQQSEHDTSCPSRGPYLVDNSSFSCQKPVSGFEKDKQAPPKGKFITVEGLDGCGSTTLRLLGETLPNVHLTAEPSSGPVGKLIRQALREEVDLSDNIFPYLFAADRKDHLESEIEPALEAGKTVITDRYYGSSLAYQSLIAPLDRIVALNEEFRAPDAVCLWTFHGTGVGS